MFKITATRAITWPELSIRKGENVYPSRKSVPAELWPKLARFRQLGLVAFDLEFDKAGQPVGDDKVVLAELTERQLFDMSKDELAELAKAEGFPVPDDLKDVKKSQLLEALVPKAKPLPKLDEPAAEVPTETKAEEPSKKAGRGGTKPVTSSTTTQG